jgi:hypothetical protein
LLFCTFRIAILMCRRPWAQPRPRQSRAVTRGSEPIRPVAPSPGWGRTQRCRPPRSGTVRQPADAPTPAQHPPGPLQGGKGIGELCNNFACPRSGKCLGAPGHRGPARPLHGTCLKAGIYRGSAKYSRDGTIMLSGATVAALSEFTGQASNCGTTTVRCLA